MKRKTLPKWVAVIMAVSLCLASVTGAAAFYTDKEESVHTVKAGDVAIKIAGAKTAAVMNRLPIIEVATGSDAQKDEEDDDLATPSEATPSEATSSGAEEIPDLDIFDDYSVNVLSANDTPVFDNNGKGFTDAGEDEFIPTEKSNSTEDDDDTVIFDNDSKGATDAGWDEFIPFDAKRGWGIAFTIQNLGSKSVYSNTILTMENIPEGEDFYIYNKSDCEYTPFVQSDGGYYLVKEGAVSIGHINTENPSIELPHVILDGSSEKDGLGNEVTYDYLILGKTDSLAGFSFKAETVAVQYRNNPECKAIGFQDSKKRVWVQSE